MSIFISYSVNESVVAESLEKLLRERGHVVDRDRGTMQSGGNWREKVLPLVEKCESFLLVWSSSADKSRNVHTEIVLALENNRHIVTCLLDETPLPGILEDVQYFHLGHDLAGFNEVYVAVAPSPQPFGAGSSAKRTAAANTFREVMRGRFASFQVLYPGDNRPTESALTLQLAEGAGDVHAAPGRESSIIDLLQGLSPGERIVLLGHPGAGKTTTLQLAAHYLCDLEDSRNLPIYLSCKDFRPARHKTLVEFAIDSIRRTANDEVADCARGFGLSEFGVGTLLIDGFDELPAGTRDQFRTQIEEFSEADDTRLIRVLLTTRIDTFRAVDLAEDWFVGWKRFRIQPLESSDVAQFAHQWFERSSDAESFLEAANDPRLIELTERPFLVAMMCLVFEKDRDLGSNRADLYRRAIEYLEQRHGEQASEHSLAQRHAILRELALKGLQMGTVDIDRWTAAGIAASRFSEEEPSRNQSFDALFAFLDEAARDVGVLQGGGTSYSFLHRSFQEYLAAEELASTPGGDEILIEHSRVPAWEEPVRLHVGGLKGSDRQLAFLRPLWQSNDALALRSLTELGRGSASVISQLLADSEPSDRVRMFQRLRASLNDVGPNLRKRLVIETAAPLLEAETDNEVLYWAVSLVKGVDAEDEDGTLWEAFGKHASGLRRTLLEDERYALSFIEVPDGTYLVGDDDAQDEIEKPQHSVTLARYLISSWQLTNVAYEFITNRSAADRPSYSREDRQPVVDLSWFDAYMAAYRIGCRLPSEAEWEVAARANTVTQWSHGDSEADLDSYANFEANPTTNGRPWAVGSAEPNPWGLFDVHGNVWEWCQDWLAPYETGAVVDPRGPATGTQRVRRGGGHSYHARGCRSAFRWGNDPGYKFKDIGVRLAMDVQKDG